MRTALFSSGEGLAYWKLTKARIVAYADRMGADFIDLPERPGDNPQWVFFDAIRESIERDYQRAAWIDADIVVGSFAHNILDERYGHRFMVCEPQTPRRVHPKWRQAVSSGKWGVPNMRPYPITAVAAWSPGLHTPMSRLVDWFDENYDRFPRSEGSKRSWWGDQELLALGIWETDMAFHFFPTGMHSMKRYLPPADSMGVEMAHPAGGNKLAKIREMLELMKGWERRRATPSSPFQKNRE